MMPINISFLGCCKDCPRRSPACSDRCADYQIAKAFHRVEVQWTREQKNRPSTMGKRKKTEVITSEHKAN